MLDLRYANVGGAIVLQMRTCGLTIDASGAFCGTSPWSEWKPVPLVADEHPKQDWRVGIAVKPKLRDHSRRGEWAIVREVKSDGQLVLERNDKDGRFTASAEDWMTA